MQLCKAPNLVSYTPNTFLIKLIALLSIFLYMFVNIVCHRNKVFQQGRVYFVGGEKHGSSSTLGNLLAIHHFGEGLQMEKISLVNNIYHVDAILYVENSAPVI